MTTLHNVREWYCEKYPLDYQKDQINPEVSFERIAASGVEPGDEDLAYLVGEWLDQAVIDSIAREYARRLSEGELEIGREYR